MATVAVALPNDLLEDLLETFYFTEIEASEFDTCPTTEEELLDLYLGDGELEVASSPGSTGVNLGVQSHNGGGGSFNCVNLKDDSVDWEGHRVSDEESAPQEGHVPLDSLASMLRQHLEGLRDGDSRSTNKALASAGNEV